MTEMQQQKYAKMQERIKVDAEKAIATLATVNADIKQYTDVSKVIDKFLEIYPRSDQEDDKVKALIDMGAGMFMQSEIDKYDKIVMKMDDEYYVELPLDRARIFVEKKLDLLQKRSTYFFNLYSSIQAHDTLLKAFLNELEVELDTSQASLSAPSL